MALAGAAWLAASDSDDVSAIMGTPPISPKVVRLKRLGPDGSIYIGGRMWVKSKRAARVCDPSLINLLYPVYGFGANSHANYFSVVENLGVVGSGRVVAMKYFLL